MKQPVLAPPRGRAASADSHIRNFYAHKARGIDLKQLKQVSDPHRFVTRRVRCGPEYHGSFAAELWFSMNGERRGPMVEVRLHTRFTDSGFA